jgi:L-alanine-DL-glutamate epimerase-like enolase superfamily enzyme
MKELEYPILMNPSDEDVQGLYDLRDMLNTTIDQVESSKYKGAKDYKKIAAVCERYGIKTQTFLDIFADVFLSSDSDKERTGDLE